MVENELRELEAWNKLIQRQINVEDFHRIIND